MDDTTYKPLDLDGGLFTNFEQSIQDLLTSHGDEITEVAQLPVSSFVDYTPKKENLNLHVQKQAAEKYISTDVNYLSSGDDSAQYVEGTVITKNNSFRDLLNIYNPTVNFIPQPKRETYDQIGGFFLPSKQTPLVYAAPIIHPYYLESDIEANTQYIFPDKTLYGPGYGNSKYGHTYPVDHRINNNWLKSPWSMTGMRGKIFNCTNMPTFYGYTSDENTIGVPKHGISKYTDNYDYWAGSKLADIWANPDVFELREANKYYITQRSYSLLTDLCDSPYRWRTDTYGNEYSLFKPSTVLPKRIHGGSDIDGDGKDDTPIAGDPRSKPSYSLKDGSPDGVPPGGIGSGGIGTDTPGQGGGIPDPKRTVDEDGNIVDEDPYRRTNESAYMPKQKSARECVYWLYGGDSLAPTDVTGFLDTESHEYDGETITGTVSAIIDGGWRPLRTGQSPGYSPTSTDWPIAGSVNEDQTENAADVLGIGGYPSYANGFVDVGMYDYQKDNWGASGIGSSEEVEWLPDYTMNSTGDPAPKMTLAMPRSEAAVALKYTVSFEENATAAESKLKKFPFDLAYRKSGRREYESNFKYKLADGGWYDPVEGSKQDTFERTECDRASYIVALYGADGKPNFGQNIFACKIWEITDNSNIYIDNQASRDWLATVEPFVGYAKEAIDGDVVYNPQRDAIETEVMSQYNRASSRGPMNATYSRNPIEWIDPDSPDGKRNIQFFGTKRQLIDALIARGIKRAQDEEYLLLADSVPGYDYLEDLEYMFMRVSPIEGAGVGSIQPNGSMYREDEITGELSDTAQFINLTGVDFENDKEKNYYYRGDPDRYFYTLDGEYDDPDTGFLIRFTAVSGEASYIDNLNDPDKVRIEDNSGLAAQFPQVWATDGRRSHEISLDMYQNMKCQNIAEYRGYTDLRVDSNMLPVGTPTTRYKVHNTHPFSTYRGKHMEIKRGYWPPPVAHMRRAQGYNTPQVTGSGSSLSITFRDHPIPDNFLPEDTDTDLQFYLHDVWDGGGFHFVPEPTVDLSKLEEPGEEKGEPNRDEGGGDITDDNAECRAAAGDADWVNHVTKWTKITYTDPDSGEESFICKPTCDTANGWWPDASTNGYTCTYTGVKGGGGGDDGTCYTCVDTGGSWYLREDCGDYEGYGGDGNFTSRIINSCHNDRYVNEDVFKMRKFRSNNNDWCEIDVLPTLWEQKHTDVRYSSLYLNIPHNAFFRNIDNKVYNLADAISTLYNKYVDVAADVVIDKNSSLVDLDVIYDIMVLRQTNDSTVGDYQTEAYVFDKLSYDYKTGLLSFDGSDVNYISTNMGKNDVMEKLITHYYNEDAGVILAGKVRLSQRLSTRKCILPEIYEYNIAKQKFTKVFPTKHFHEIEHELDTGIFSGREIMSYDPGEISYNHKTNDYSITYMIYVAAIGEEPVPCLINTILSPRGDGYELMDVTCHHPENWTNTLATGSVADDFTLQELDQADDTAVTTSITLSSFEHIVEISPARISSNVLWMDIDWGDGEQVRVYSDLAGQLQRYTVLNWIDKFTYINPNTSGAVSTNGTSLTRHRVGHVYKSTGTGETYKLKIKCHYASNELSYERTIDVVTASYTINQSTSNKGVKLMNTRLYSDTTGKQRLLLTFETQGAERLLAHNVIDI